MEILRVYQKDGFTITEWSKDRQTVSHTTKVATTSDEYEAVEYPNLEITPAPTIEEKILYETQYQTMLIETSMSF